MNKFIVYQLLYASLLYLALSSLTSWLSKRNQIPRVPAWYLKLGAALACLTAASLPFVGRIFVSSSLMLPWECDTVLNHFDAYQKNQSLLEFARESFRRNPGLLSTSGNSLLFGIPTFAIFQTFGWNPTSLRLASYLMGLASLVAGFVTIRILFNSSVALIFTTIFATNPLFIHYMGYGVSQTATVCGFFTGLAITAHALKSTSKARFIWAGLAGLALFMATYNYAPARIFVVATLGFLVLYSSSVVRTRDSSTPSRAAAFMIVAMTVGLYVAEKRLNPSSDFTTVRGEQAFAMLTHRDALAQYLNNSSEIQSLPPGPLPFGIKVRFLLAVASERIREFITHYSPMDRLIIFHERGSQHGDAFRPYQSALIIPIVIGFFGALRTRRSTPSLLLFCLFFIGIGPLFLTNRIDNHRSLLLLFPLTTWAAHGIWILLSRLRGGWLAELHSATIWSTITIAMILNAWFFMGEPDPVDQGVERLLARSSPYIDSGASVIPTMLNCQTHAMMALKLAEARRIAQDSPPILWPTGIGQQLTDERFTTDSQVLSGIIESARVAPVVIVSTLPLNKFSEWVQTSPLQSTEGQEDSLRFTVLRKR